jgi:hypothetical protein
MKKVFLTMVALTLVLCSFCEQDATNLQKDTIGYELELKEFYNFLTTNYNKYKIIELHNNEEISILEKECEKIASIIYSKSEYVDQEMAVYNSSTSSFIYYDVGGKNCPEVYGKIFSLHKLCRKMVTIKNEKKWRRMNVKLMKKIDAILEIN